MEENFCCSLYVFAYHRVLNPSLDFCNPCFVHAVASEDDLLPKAIARAAQLAPLGANRELYSQSKERIFGEHPSINAESGAAHQLRNMKRH